MVVVLLLGRDSSAELEIRRFVSSLAIFTPGASLPVVLRTFNGNGSSILHSSLTDCLVSLSTHRIMDSEMALRLWIFGMAVDLRAACISQYVGV